LLDLIVQKVCDSLTQSLGPILLHHLHIMCRVETEAIFFHFREKRTVAKIVIEKDFFVFRDPFSFTRKDFVAAASKKKM
jgi:hypothetical protein